MKLNAYFLEQLPAVLFRMVPQNRNFSGIGLFRTQNTFDCRTFPGAEPFREEDYSQAILSVQYSLNHYDPSVIGYEWDDSNPRIQLEPRGERGYIEMRAIQKRGTKSGIIRRYLYPLYIGGCSRLFVFFRKPETDRLPAQRIHAHQRSPDAILGNT